MTAFPTTTAAIEALAADHAAQVAPHLTPEMWADLAAWQEGEDAIILLDIDALLDAETTPRVVPEETYRDPAREQDVADFWCAFWNALCDLIPSTED